METREIDSGLGHQGSQSGDEAKPIQTNDLFAG